MKLFFDGCKIRNYDPVGRITLLLSGPDMDKFFPQLQQIITKDNPPVDITLNYPWLQLNEAECEKCHKVTDYIITIPNRVDYPSDIEFKNAQVRALESIPDYLICKHCGESFN